MKGLMILATAVSVIAASSFELGAKSPHQIKKDRHHSSAYAARRPSSTQSDDWYPRDSSKLPFGSSRWWDQMLREDRLTCCS